MEKKLKLVTEKKQNQSELISEKPISEFSPRMKFGTLIKRARRRRKKMLRDVAEQIDVTAMVISEVERGHRPLSWESVEIICGYLEVPDIEIFQQALMEFHYWVWNEKKEFVLSEQTEQVSSIFPQYDIVELVTAMKGNISTMDIAKGALERANRVMRVSGYEKDAEMCAQALLLLDASAQVSLGLLENPPDPLPDSESK